MKSKSIKHNQRALYWLLVQLELARTAEVLMDKCSRKLEETYPVCKMEKFGNRFLRTVVARCRDWASAAWKVVVRGWLAE